MAATLENVVSGQRSGVRPVWCEVVSQNQSNVRFWRLSRNAVSSALSAATDGAVGGTSIAKRGGAQATKTRARPRYGRNLIGARSG